MKKLVYTFAVISTMFLMHTVRAQAPDILWTSYVMDYVGNIYCVESTNDNGYIVGGDYGSHSLIFKLDGSGVKQWGRWITTGTGLTTVAAIKQTADGGYIAAGSDFGGADSIGNHGIRDFMVVKLDASGNVSWIKAYGGTSSEEAKSIAQTPDGGYIVVGYTVSNDGDLAGNPAPWYSEWWVVKLDASGNIVWQKAMGGGNYDYAASVVITADGGYAVTGYSQSKDGDVSGTHWGGSDPDVWVVKLNASGDIVWQESYGGSGEDEANSIWQTSDGGYIVAGYTLSNDGNVSGIHGGGSNQDYWVIKLDATGTLVWQKCLGGTGSGTGAGSGNDIAYAVRQTADGGYIVAGTVSSGSAVNGDISGYHGQTASDYWVVQLDASGNIAWEKCLGGNGKEDARAVALAPDGGYVIAGTTQYSLEGDVTGIVGLSYNDQHPWIVKLKGNGASGISESITELSVAIYPNPANEFITLTNLPSHGTVTILDATGKAVYHSVINTTQGVIDISGFASGVYSVLVRDNGRVANRKFVVNR